MNELTTPESFESCLAASESGPVLIYKHSSVCGTSAGAYARLRDHVRGAPDGVPPVHMVRVIESRPISNAVAEQLGVRHESPQLILVRGRRAVWSASHHAITADAIEGALSALAP